MNSFRKENGPHSRPTEGTLGPDIERGAPSDVGRENDERLRSSGDELPTHSSSRTKSLPGMTLVNSSQRTRRSDDARSEFGTHSFHSSVFSGDQSFDISGHRQSLTRRPKQFRRAVDPEDLESQPNEDPMHDDCSEIDEVSLNDEHGKYHVVNTSFVTNDHNIGRTLSVATEGSYVSSWDSIAGKRSLPEDGDIAVTPRLSKPSHLSSLSSHGDRISSFRSLSLSGHLSISNRDRARMNGITASFVSIHEGKHDDDDDDDDDDEEEEFGGEGGQTEAGSTAPGEKKPTSSGATESLKSRIGQFWVWFDDWLRRKIQWFYVLAVLYVGPVCFAWWAPLIWVSALFYTSMAFVTFVNAWMCFEVFFSVLYTRRMRKLHHITRPKLIGERRLGCIVCAYLPNELTVLVQTVKAIANTIHELPEGTTMDIVLSHNGGKKEQRISLLLDLRTIERELPPNVMVHELNVISSRSKAENVNAALGFFTELGKIRRKPFTQLAMYDADHQPIPQAWRYALETMQDQKADMVMGRCCVADGMKTIAIEFDILYSIGHAGGRCVRGFGFFGGSNGYWDAKTLTETGMDEGMLTEDVDSSFRAQSAGHFMTYDPTIVSYEESPPNFSGLFKQRLRWAQGWYEVTLRQITLPFRKAPGLTLWSRFCLFLLLPFREAYVYFSSFMVPIAIVYLTKRCDMPTAWGCVDINLLGFAGFCMLVPIVMTIMAWNVTHDPYVNIHYRMPTLKPLDYFKYILTSYFYELFKIHLTVMGHIRQILSLNKWVVTKRKSTTDQVAPTITPSMVRMTVPDTLIRMSPFARSTRQMFAGSYDEKRPKRFEHCSTDIGGSGSAPTYDETPTDGTRSTDDSFARDDTSSSRNSTPEQSSRVSNPNTHDARQTH